MKVIKGINYGYEFNSTNFEVNLIIEKIHIIMKY
jgi:hypothetical protein